MVKNKQTKTSSSHHPTNYHFRKVRWLWAAEAETSWKKASLEWTRTQRKLWSSTVIRIKSIFRLRQIHLHRLTPPCDCSPSAGFKLWLNDNTNISIYSYGFIFLAVTLNEIYHILAHAESAPSKEGRNESVMRKDCFNMFTLAQKNFGLMSVILKKGC